MSGWGCWSPEAQQRADEARRTILLLAHQVGVRCVQCGTVMHSSGEVGAVSFMAPMGTEDYQGRAYCVPCAEGMRDQ